MNKLLRAEWIKFRASRSNWILLTAGLVLAIALVVIGVLLFGNSVGGTQPDTSIGQRAQLIGAGSIMSLLLVSIVGVRVFGSEWRTGTMQTAAIAAPIRPELYFAKVLVMVIVGAVYGLVVSGLSATAAFIGLGVKDFPLDFADADTLRIAVGYTVLCVLYGVVGVFIGSLFRSTALATALVIALPAFVETAIGVVLPGDAKNYLPFAAGGALLKTGDTPISPIEGGIILAAFAAVLLVVGEVVFARRDLG